MGIRKRVADALELQHDVALNLPVLHVTGGERLLMENHRGLLEFGREKIRIASAAGDVTVEGEDLNVQSVGRDEILITGVIRSVEFARPGAKR